MDRFDYNIVHVPGKQLCTADTLSRSPTATSGPVSLTFQNELEGFIGALVATFPASSERIKVYEKAQKDDPICSNLITYCLEGWPDKNKISTALRPYWNIRSELSVGDNLLLRNLQIVVPASLQKETLEKIHVGHQGIQKCQLRANTAVWWPGMSKQITRLVKTCPECTKHSKPSREPLLSAPLPSYPWQKVGADLFYFKGKTYLVVVDYFSRYPEVLKLQDTTSKGLITALKPIFARHGIPEILISDNGPQFASQEMKQFASMFGFTHITSSPHYPRSNGLAERTVQTVKSLMAKSTDLNLALLSYRSTPLQWCRLSPSELLMGRRLRSTLPQPNNSFLPAWSYLEKFREQDHEFKREQERQYNKCHRTQQLPELPNDTAVWITTDGQTERGTVRCPAETPRSYLVDTPTSTVRRNRQDLIPVPIPEHDSPPVPEVPEPDSSSQSTDADSQQSGSVRNSPVQTRLRTGSTIKPPDKLNL